MGQCLSVSASDPPIDNYRVEKGSIAVTQKENGATRTSPRRRQRPSKLDTWLVRLPKSPTKKRGLESGVQHLDLISPTSSQQSDSTQPITPFSLLETPLGPTPGTFFGKSVSPSSPSSSPPAKEKLQVLDEHDSYDEDDDDDEMDENRISNNGAFPSLDRSSLCFQDKGINDVIETMKDVMETAIEEEEESQGAPSDEEDDREKDQNGEKTCSKSEVGTIPLFQQPVLPDDEPTPKSKTSYSRIGPKDSLDTAPHVLPIKPQSQVKLLSKRITSPQSIIHRPPSSVISLVAPPKGSAPDLTSNTTKASVNPHTIADFHKLKIQAKLANRAAHHRRHKAKLEDRMEDVMEYRRIWTEYEHIQEQVAQPSEAEDDSKASDSLSLKQPTTWYFDFQNLDRITKEDDDNRSVSHMSLLSEASMEAQRRIFAEKQKQRKRKGKKKHKKKESSGDRSVSSRRSNTSRRSRSSTIRVETEGNDYGPIQRTNSCASLTVGTFTLTDMQVVYASDDSTPKARGDDYSRASAFTDDGSWVTEVDGDNDYGVRRRRPRKNYNHEFRDDETISTFGYRSFEDRSYDSYKGPRIGMDYFVSKALEGSNAAPVTIEVKKNARKSSPTPMDKYGFDPSVPFFPQDDVPVISLPSVEIDNAATGQVRWRQFTAAEEDLYGKKSAARCLEDIFGRQETEVEAQRKPELSSVRITRESPNETHGPIGDSVLRLEALASDQIEGKSVGGTRTLLEFLQEETTKCNEEQSENKYCEGMNQSETESQVNVTSELEPDLGLGGIAFVLEGLEYTHDIQKLPSPAEVKSSAGPLCLVISKDANSAEKAAGGSQSRKDNTDREVDMTVAGNVCDRNGKAFLENGGFRRQRPPARPAEVDKNDPCISKLSTEQFLFIASAENMSLTDQEQFEGEESVCNSCAAESSTTSNLNCDRLPATVKRYDPIIANMSTEDFYGLSLTINHTDPRRIEEDFDNTSRVLEFVAVDPAANARHDLTDRSSAANLDFNANKIPDKSPRNGLPSN